MILIVVYLTPTFGWLCSVEHHLAIFRRFEDFVLSSGPHPSVPVLWKKLWKWIQVAAWCLSSRQTNLLRESQVSEGKASPPHNDGWYLRTSEVAWHAWEMCLWAMLLCKGNSKAPNNIPYPRNKENNLGFHSFCTWGSHAPWYLSKHSAVW